MKKRLQLSVNKSLKLMLHKFSRINSPVKILTTGRKTRLFLECDQKCDQAKSKAIEINFNLDFYSSNSIGCPWNG